MGDDVVLWVGESRAAGLARIGKMEEGLYRDFDLVFPLFLRTVKMAPAGSGGEFRLTRFWLTIAYSIAASIRIVPILDGVALETQGIVLTDPGVVSQPVRLTRTFGVSRPVEFPPGSEAIRLGARGSWLQFYLDIVDYDASDGVLWVDGIEFEYEVLREGHTAEALGAVATVSNPTGAD